MKNHKEFWAKLFGETTREDVEFWLRGNPQKCLCGKQLSYHNLSGFKHKHPNGIKLFKYGKVWLYLHCPKCRYDLSWHHWR